MIAVETTECILWPHAKNEHGYGRLHFNGRRWYAHRLALFLTSGAPPDGKADAAHSCRNRDCFNPVHLSWKSSADNWADMHRDGTAPVGEAHSSAILTESAVREIRAAVPVYGQQTILRLAEKHGVSVTTARHARSGRRWAHVAA